LQSPFWGLIKTPYDPHTGYSKGIQVVAKKREKVVRVLLSEAEKREAQRAADRAGMALAVFTRVAVLEKARDDAKPEAK
jgi:hypothetical protein